MNIDGICSDVSFMLSTNTLRSYGEVIDSLEEEQHIIEDK